MPSPGGDENLNEVHSRYGYLLKPIRDLCKNWEINIAGELEEYLNEMEQIKISFDDGETVMNFAEAALLIQGSACIYSKKVEYLYTLVYQTLDLIASRRQLQQGPSIDDLGKDKDVSTLEQDKFLLLDDIKEANNADMKEDSSYLEAAQLIPRTPVTLITFDGSKKGAALMSLTGEILGNRNDFKMNTCSVHMSSGALLHVTSSFTSGVFSRSSKENIECETESKNENMDAVDNFDDVDDMLCVSRDCDDGMDCDLPCSPPPDTLHVSQRTTLHDGMQLRCKKENGVHMENSPPKHIKDPWETLDPHDPNGGVEKAYKKGRPFKIPQCVRDDKVSVKKRKRKTQEDSFDEKLIPIAEFCKLAYHSQVEKLPKNPLKTLTYHEFEYIYWNEFRRRQILERKHRKAMVAMGNADGEMKKEIVDDSDDENNNDEQLQEDLDYHGGFNDEFDDDDITTGCQGDLNGNPAEGIEPMALEASDELVVSSYEELVRKHVQGFLAQAQAYVQETDLSRRVLDWEKKVVPKLENEDTHEPYDIHEYGDDLLARFEDAQVKSFEDVVPRQEPWEVCRYFLASLQLANNNNIEIFESRNDNKLDCMKLKLLRRTRIHQGISLY